MRDDRDLIERLRANRYECFVDESAGLAEDLEDEETAEENRWTFDRPQDDPDNWGAAYGAVDEDA